MSKVYLENMLEGKLIDTTNYYMLILQVGDDIFTADSVSTTYSGYTKVTFKIVLDKHQALTVNDITDISIKFENLTHKIINVTTHALSWYNYEFEYAYGKDKHIAIFDDTKIYFDYNPNNLDSDRYVKRILK